MAVVKIIRIIGNSPQSWAKAAAAGAKEAARTVRNITGIEATDFPAPGDARGTGTEYRGPLHVAFLLARGAGGGGGDGGRSGGGSAGRGRAGGGDGGARRRLVRGQPGRAGGFPPGAGPAPEPRSPRSPVRSSRLAASPRCSASRTACAAVASPAAHAATASMPSIVTATWRLSSPSCAA